MRRETLKMAQLDLDFMEVKQRIEESTNSSYQNPDFKEYLQKEEQKMRIDLPAHLAEPYRPEEEEEEKEELKQQTAMEVDTVRSGKMRKNKSVRDSDYDQRSALEPENSINSDHFPNVEPPLGQALSSASSVPQIPAGAPQQPPKDQKAIIDPTTVMQLHIMYHKLNYIGMQVDRNRIKISNREVIKKDNFLNLTQEEVEREVYFRGGARPKSLQKEEDSKCKYTIFQARNKRVLILRKLEGGNYETFNEGDRTQRVKSEPASHLKRMKVSENDEYEGFRHTVSPALQYEIKNTYGDCYNIDEEDSDDNMSEGETHDDADDYTAGFIERFKERRGNKGNKNNTNLISFRVGNT
mmetsp:Transcript_9715/g.11000  ORF Transcript_9715/g.11000 Transcript_9715/m.11000 type:complete len:353 (-) Transcript_9715:115-1173(-)